MEVQKDTLARQWWKLRLGSHIITMDQDEAVCVVEAVAAVEGVEAEAVEGEEEAEEVVVEAVVAAITEAGIDKPHSKPFRQAHL